jgi:hypothetical protein
MKHIEYIRFDDSRIKPNKFCICIQKNDEISKTIRREHRGRAPNITKNKFKRSRCFVT